MYLKMGQPVRVDCQMLREHKLSNLLILFIKQGLMSLSCHTNKCFVNVSSTNMDRHSISK